jgi:hypothetical protein
MAINLIAMLFDQFVPFGGFEVFPDHFGNKFLKGDSRRQAEFLPGLGGVSQ